MSTRFYKKFDGWPAMVIGALAMSALAYYGAITYRSLEEEKVGILAELESARIGNYELLQTIRERESIIKSFQGQIGKISSTVGTLEKLAQTDEELLKKYSKVYFLNENYIPARLTEIDKQYVYNGTTNYQLSSDVLPFINKLLEAARQDGIELMVASAYRSFDTQASLKSEYKVLYGAGTANQFSADQGYSEHQLGTAVDFTTAKTGGIFSTFKVDPAYKWLEANAHDYGFTLSYPEGNSYYKFEPWHWRFVGRALATMLQDQSKHFYDLDQREIDNYLIKLFD